METKKPVAARQRCKAFDLLSTPAEDHEIILPPLQRKSLDAKQQGFIVDSPKKACFLKGWKQKNPWQRASAARLLTC
ncbi:MAG: hypothetical protein ABSA76_01925 [Bacteroidales bacterium]